MQDHFGLFGPCDFERAPTGAELLAGIAAVQTRRHSEIRVLTRHVKAASNIIARFMDGNAHDEMATTISIARCLVGSDVPPILSSTAVWSPIPQTTEVGREEAVFGRTDHRVSA